MGASESAFVWTDKKEYDPSETVYIFGYGFNAYAQVTVTIQRPDSSQDTILTSTDEFGYFTCQYVLDGIHGTYIVTATDEVNTATTTFNNKLDLKVKWDEHDCTFIKAQAIGLAKTKSYYVKYFDPAGVERRIGIGHQPLTGISCLFPQTGTSSPQTTWGTWARRGMQGASMFLGIGKTS